MRSQQANVFDVDSYREPQVNGTGELKMEHKLKILSRYYEAILQGKKTFEVRKDDRNFQQGDTLLLEECVTPDGCCYTGREMKVDVTYILRDSEYVKDGYCIMGIKIISTNKSKYYDNTPS